MKYPSEVGTENTGFLHLYNAKNIGLFIWTSLKYGQCNMNHGWLQLGYENVIWSCSVENRIIRGWSLM